MFTNILPAASNVSRRAPQSLVAVLFAITMFVSPAAAQTTTTTGASSQLCSAGGIASLISLIYTLAMLVPVVAGVWYLAMSSKESAPEKKAKYNEAWKRALYVFIALLMFPTILSLVQGTVGYTAPISGCLPW